MARSNTAEKIVFQWEGTDRRGSRIKGEAMSASEALVKADLRRQGINPLKVKKKPKPLFGGSKRITPGDIAVFSRQLATMMESGVPLVQALEIIGTGHANPAMQALVLKVKSDIEGGTSLADALGRHRVYFDDLFVNLVRAGEQSGSLETMLDKVATYKEKTEAMKAKIKKAMFYPTAVLVVAFVVTAILLIFVVPQFEDLFKGFGADLPAFTRMVIDLSQFMQHNWWLVFGAIGAGIFGFIQAKKRSRRFAEYLDRLSLQIPIIGSILNNAAIGRFARTLSTMFAAGVPLVEAMDSVAGATGNVVYSNAVLRMKDEVSTGTQLQQSMRNSALFPNMVVQMVAIGEESGSLDAMLAKVADFYEAEVDNAVDALSSLLEPLIMVLLGTIVGGLVVSMYLPIFKMGSAI